MASGDILALFLPHDNEPPSSNAATPDEVNNHPVLDFDPGSGAEEVAIFSGLMPQHYGGGSIDFFIHWGTESVTTSEVCRWETQVEVIADGGTAYSADSFDSADAQPVDATVPSTTARVMDVASTRHTQAQADGVAAGNKFRVKLTRKSAHANDTMNSNDAEFHALELREV